VTKRSFWSLLLVSTAVELLVFYRPQAPVQGAATALFTDLALQTALLLGLPVTWIKLVARTRVTDAGLSLPPARQWLPWLLPFAAVVLPLALAATRIPSIHASYPRLEQAREQHWLLAPSTLAFAGYGLAWEFFFRGFMMMGLKARLGHWAVVLQAFPCAVMHLGKPELEVLASFPSAIVLGAIAYRAGSVVPAWLLHMAIALVINLGCVFWPL